jgi:hypothetical protein
MINGVDPYKIIRGWSDKEKEAAYKEATKLANGVASNLVLPAISGLVAGNRAVLSYAKAALAKAGSDSEKKDDKKEEKK